MHDKSLTDVINIDVTTPSLESLRSVYEKIGSEIQRREVAERRRVEKTIVDMATAHGIDLAKLRPPKAKPSGPVYADPERPFRTWPGKGPKPKWLKELLDKGTPLETLLQNATT